MKHMKSTGHMLISKEQVLRLASSEAVTFAKDSVTMVKAALAEDAAARKSGQDVGLANLLKPQVGSLTQFSSFCLFSNDSGL